MVDWGLTAFLTQFRSYRAYTVKKSNVMWREIYRFPGLESGVHCMVTLAAIRYSSAACETKDLHEVSVVLPLTEAPNTSAIDDFQPTSRYISKRFEHLL